MSEAAADLLAERALELGASVVGWADTEIPAEAVAEYQDWLNAGRHAGMAYLERQLPRRADLSTSLEGVGRALVLGIAHSHEEPPRPSGGIRLGRVARYAWTQDYHEQIEPILAQLTLQAEQSGLRARGYVDHGPIMERLLAGHSFLGWRSKSGMLVSTQLGAFFTLAVLLTDLPPTGGNRIHPDRCGKCFRCGVMCPTGAIGDDRKIDARRCLSYLTIEHRGPLPTEHREALGEWLFGCDVCCEVCPWSIKAGKLARLFVPRSEFAFPDLQSFFDTSERQFARRWEGAAFLRPRRKGMARNALNVAANIRAPEAWPLIASGMRDPAPEVREAAAWALARWERWAELEKMRADESEIVSARAEAELAAR